jgi:DNA invertase Pin-like site-specific DNA recombinase
LTESTKEAVGQRQESAAAKMGREIRELYAQGESVADLALDFRVNQETVRRIVNGEGTWAFLDKRPGAGGKRAPTVRPLSEEDVREVRELYAAGTWTYATLAARFGVTTATVYHIIAAVGGWARLGPSLLGRRKTAGEGE